MSDSLLSLKNISLTLEKKVILENIDFSLDEKEIACLLGPSGCGKTTLLRIIAGLEERSTGEITLNNKIIQDKKTFVSPQKRNIGMVFQDYALFPHLNVSENITLGLDHLKKSERQQKLTQMLELVKLEAWRESYPHKLSGGQQQRVALARALAQSPNILLLDEPFSNLDTELRYQLSEDVRSILKELGMSAILVTHDQTEAFSFADKIGLMKEGHIDQLSSTYDLYHAPQTPFAASFIGEGSIVLGSELKAYMPHLSLSMNGKILVRPQDIILDEASLIKAKVAKKIFRGSHYLYLLDFDNGLKVLSSVQGHHEHNIGDLIGVRIEFKQVVEFPF